MGERTRRHVQREAAPTRPSAPVRTTDTAETTTDDRARSSANPMLDLQASAGNRAVTELVLQRAPDQTGDNVITAQTQQEAAADLQAAEAWVTFVALRGNAPPPARSVPSRYTSQVTVLQAAVGGPGPIPGGIVSTTAMLLDPVLDTVARAVIGKMQADHKSLLPKESMDAYVPVDFALELGEKNRKANVGPATALNQGYEIGVLKGDAEDEVKLAREGGYDVPSDLAALPAELGSMWDEARKGWIHGAPTDAQVLSPTDELDLSIEVERAAGIINSMRARRYADIARALRQQEEQLRKANDEQMAQLQKALAEKRKQAFDANDHGVLDSVSEALGSAARAIDDTKAAAGIISQRVDQVNEVVSLISKGGKEAIKLPELPAGLEGAADWIGKANEKIKFVIDVLDLIGPAKTDLDGGLKYLKAADMSLQHLGGKSANPFISVYVNSYLSPGLEHCMESIGTIAQIASSENRSLIGAGEGARVGYWGVESGGEAMYLFITSVYKFGGAAQVSPEAWAYLSSQRDSFEAAVGAPMPKEQRAVAAWAAGHKLEIWQSLYGSTRPPY